MKATWVTFLNAEPLAAYRPVLCKNNPYPAEWTYKYGKTVKFLQSHHETEIYQFIHSVVFKNLDPTCWYEYRVSNMDI